MPYTIFPQARRVAFLSKYRPCGQGMPPATPLEYQAIMATNEIPTKYNDVVALAEDAEDGALPHGVAINLKQNTAATIRTDLDALTTAEATAARKRSAKAAASAVRQTTDSNAKAFISLFILAEKPRLGSQ